MQASTTTEAPFWFTSGADKWAQNVRVVSSDDRFMLHRDYANDNIEFAVWLALVDIRIGQALFGMSLFDLADRNWRDLFEDGVSPRHAAFDALDDEGVEY